MTVEAPMVNDQSTPDLRHENVVFVKIHETSCNEILYSCDIQWCPQHLWMIFVPGSSKESPTQTKTYTNAPERPSTECLLRTCTEWIGCKLCNSLWIRRVHLHVCCEDDNSQENLSFFHHFCANSCFPCNPEWIFNDLAVNLQFSYNTKRFCPLSSIEQTWQIGLSLCALRKPRPKIFSANLRILCNHLLWLFWVKCCICLLQSIAQANSKPRSSAHWELVCWQTAHFLFGWMAPRGPGFTWQDVRAPVQLCFHTNLSN